MGKVITVILLVLLLSYRCRSFRRVMCYHRLTGALLATTISSADGSYRFDDLIAGVKYFITSVDENNDGVQYNAVTQDLITASEVTA